MDKNTNTEQMPIRTVESLNAEVNEIFRIIAASTLSPGVIDRLKEVIGDLRVEIANAPTEAQLAQYLEMLERARALWPDENHQSLHFEEACHGVVVGGENHYRLLGKNWTAAYEFLLKEEDEPAFYHEPDRYDERG